MADTVESPKVKEADHKAEVPKADFARAQILLDVIHNASIVGQSVYGSIISVAGMELKDMNDKLTAELAKIAAAEAAKVAKAKADADAKAAAQIVLDAKAAADAKAKAEADAIAQAKTIAPTPVVTPAPVGGPAHV